MNNETIIQNIDITNISISDGAYRCYILLQSMCYGLKDTCYPSEKYIATALGRSVRTIQRYLKKLVKHKLIIVRRRGSISNLYTVLVKKTKQVGERVTSSIKSAYKAYKTKKEASKSSNSTFNSFPQRDYNFTSLESMLLGFTAYNEEELYNNQT